MDAKPVCKLVQVTRIKYTKQVASIGIAQIAEKAAEQYGFSTNA